MSDHYKQRFDGIRRVYGDTAAALIREFHICVVGIGGVGSWAVEALARTGVGKITIIDNDTVSLSNTNRQIHTLGSTVNQSKVQLMAERIRDINPDCTVNVIDDFLTMQTLEKFLLKDYDYVIDAIDSIKFKSAMINHCKRNKIKIVMTGGAGGLTDPTAIKVDDLSRTHNDPLAAKVRSQLRQDYGFPKEGKRRFGIECVYSTQQQLYPKADGSVSHEKPGIHGVSLDCRFGYGSLTYVTATFGFIAVSRAVNKLVKARMAAARS